MSLFKVNINILPISIDFRDWYIFNVQWLIEYMFICRNFQKIENL